MDISNQIVISSNWTDSVVINYAIVKSGWVFISVNITAPSTGSAIYATITNAYRPAVDTYAHVGANTGNAISSIYWGRFNSSGSIQLWLDATERTATFTVQGIYPVK